MCLMSPNRSNAARTSGSVTSYLILRIKSVRVGFSRSFRDASSRPTVSAPRYRPERDLIVRYARAIIFIIKNGSGFLSAMVSKNNRQATETRPDRRDENMEKCLKGRSASDTVRRVKIGQNGMTFDSRICRKMGFTALGPKSHLRLGRLDHQNYRSSESDHSNCPSLVYLADTVRLDTWARS
jgi:hypothetical protein